MNSNNEKVKNLSKQLSIRNSIFLAILVVWGTAISCSPSQKETKPEQMQQQIEALKTISEPESPATITPVQQIKQGEVVQTGETSTEENINSTQAINSTAPELNPPHGQPFHRCDIPVGSPLNTPAPAANINQVSTTTSTSPTRSSTSPTIENAMRLNNTQANTPVTQPLASSAQPRLNPAHGQPFHRCDIAVGSPLPVN